MKMYRMQEVYIVLTPSSNIDYIERVTANQEEAQEYEKQGYTVEKRFISLDLDKMLDEFREALKIGLAELTGK